MTSAIFFYRCPRRKRSLLEAIVETGEEMRDGFFGFVAHIREAEGLTFDFAVAAVDDEVMFFARDRARVWRRRCRDCFSRR